jgi:Leucine Rich repeat
MGLVIYLDRSEHSQQNAFSTNDDAMNKTMNDQERHNQLLELLERDQSKEAFQAVFKIFASWPDGVEKCKALVLADRALDAWDDSSRHLDSGRSYLYEGKKLAPIAYLIRSIEIYRREENGTKELWAIVKSEYVRNLRRLAILSSEVSSAAIKALSESPYLANLRHLAIRRTDLLTDAIESLLQARSLPNLKTLQLIDVCNLRRHLHLISQSIPFGNLREVDFSESLLGSEGAAILSQAPWLRFIETLELRGNFIRAEGITALARSPYIQALKTLDLSRNRMLGGAKEILLEMAKEKGIRLIV